MAAQLLQAPLQYVVAHHGPGASENTSPDDVGDPVAARPDWSCVQLVDVATGYIVRAPLLSSQFKPPLIGQPLQQPPGIRW